MNAIVKRLNRTNGIEASGTVFDNARQADAIFENRVHVIGFAFDGTACFRTGARNGPDAIREVTCQVETYSPYLDREIAENSFIDLGNITVEKHLEKTQVEAAWRKATDLYIEIIRESLIRKNNVKFLTLGGEHSVSYAPIKCYLETWPDLVILHIDAHADLRDGYEGYDFSHASIIKRVLECFGNGHRLIQHGIRSGTGEEFEWMRKNRTLIADLDPFLEEISRIPDQRPIYLTLDLDYFDPALLPGTGTPEPGGGDFRSVVEIMKVLRSKHLVGADLVELAPAIDPTGNSSILAATVAREVLLTLLD